MEELEQKGSRSPAVQIYVCKTSLSLSVSAWDADVNMYITILIINVRITEEQCALNV